MNQSNLRKQLNNLGIDKSLLNQFFKSNYDEDIILEKILFFSKYSDQIIPESKKSIISAFLFLESRRVESFLLDGDTLLIINDYINFFKNVDKINISIQFYKSVFSIFFLLIEVCYYLNKNILPDKYLTKGFCELVVLRFLPFIKKVQNRSIEEIVLRFPLSHNLIELIKDGHIKIEINKGTQLTINKRETEAINGMVAKIKQDISDFGIKASLHFDNNSVLRFHYFDISNICYSNWFIDIKVDANSYDTLKNFKYNSWQIYSIIIGNYHPNPNSLRDWISSPRSNGYEALHWDVLLLNKIFVSIRITKSVQNEGNNIDRINFLNAISSGFEIIDYNNLIVDKFKNLVKVNSRFFARKTFSFEEYVEFMMEVKQFAVMNDFQLIIRGQRRDYKLVPSLMRPKFSTINELVLYEAKILNEFARTANPLLSEYNISPMELISICQHHGLPTRLLDWTENPLVALWFACTSPFQYPENKAIIWCYFALPDEIASFDIDPFTIKSTLIYKPRYLTDRIQAQSGLFTVHPLQDLPFAPLEDAKLRVPLIKVSLPAKVKKETLSKLNYLNINDFTIMKDLDGLASWIKSKNEWM